MRLQFNENLPIFIRLHFHENRSIPTKLQFHEISRFSLNFNFVKIGRFSWNLNFMKISQFSRDFNFMKSADFDRTSISWKSADFHDSSTEWSFESKECLGKECTPSQSTSSPVLCTYWVPYFLVAGGVRRNLQSGSTVLEFELVTEGLQFWEVIRVSRYSSVLPRGALK